MKIPQKYEITKKNLALKTKSCKLRQYDLGSLGILDYIFGKKRLINDRILEIISRCGVLVDDS